ncbi:MAG: DUF5117 domain-containing protein, partial [Bacteroidota bacterium]
MHRTIPTLLPIVAFVILLAGCSATQATVQSSEKASQTSNAGPDTSKGDKFGEAVKASRALEGLFTVYQDTTDGSLHLAISEDQIGREYIYFSHTVEGIPRVGHFRGAYRDNRVFSIQKHYNTIEFVAENPSFYFDEENPLSRAADANISRAVLAVQKVIAKDDSSDVYLIKADDLFLTEAFHQVKPTPPQGVPPGRMFSLGRLSKEKTRYVDVRNYPMNTDVIVEYVYQDDSPSNRGGSEVTDARNVSIRIQHTLIEMPENDFQPRFDDPRVGFFAQQVTDLTSPSATPYRDLITRWNLVKKDPNAAVSEPVEPIVWWIENTTPKEIRNAVREAVLAWNIAFEAAGFQNAVEVKVQP